MSHERANKQFYNKQDKKTKKHLNQFDADARKATEEENKKLDYQKIERE